jgi:IS605 OrfB family transposase
MESYEFHPRLVHRTARVRLRVTRHQADRCFGLLRSAGDLWAWLLDTNRERLVQGAAPIVGYQALCRELTARGPAGELSVVGARSVLARYSDSWFAAAKRRRKGEPAGFPTPQAPAGPGPLPPPDLSAGRPAGAAARRQGPPRAVGADGSPHPVSGRPDPGGDLGGRLWQLWLAVTAAVPIHHHDLDPRQVAGVDLGIIHPYAVVAEHAALLVSGRAIRAESFLHLRDQQARQAKTARRAPKPGQHGSRRWRRYRARLRRVEARHRRRVHQAHHQAASQVVAFAVRQRIGVLVIGDPTGITTHDAGRVHNRRLRQWRRTHLVQALSDKAEQAGIDVRRVDERGTSSPCPACRRRVPKPSGRRFRCLACTFQGHRDLVGAANIAATLGGGTTSATLPTLVEHRRAGIVPARRDRRRHLHDQRRRRSCLASGHPDGHKGSSGCHSPHATTDPASDEDQATRRNTANVA